LSDKYGINTRQTLLVCNVRNAALLKNRGEVMENHDFEELDDHRGKGDASVASRKGRVFSLSFMYRYDETLI